MTRTSTPHAWRRLALAAFVVALYTSLALSSGVARADEGPSTSGTESGTTGATTSDTATSDTTKSDTTKSGTATSGTASRPAPHRGAKPPNPRRTARAAAESDAPDSVRPARRDAVVQPEAPAAVEAPGEVPTPIDATEPDATEPEAAPSTPPLADVAHKSRTSSRPAPEVPSARTERTLRSVSSPAGTSPPGTSPPDTSPTDTAPADSTPADTARVGADPTEASTAVAPPRPASATPPNLALQLAGGLSDVGTITVSVVHAVATAVAHAFGPDSFLGVPYLLATAVANTAAAVGRTLVGATLTEPSAGQFAVNYGLLDGLAFFNPTKPPAGANDPSITVTAEHPLPVILLNPTALTQGLNWAVGAPVLANAGYKVYTFNYGNVTANPNAPIQSIGDIRKSAQELSAEIDRVLAETGAPQVILIGHSQGGGNLPAYYINNMGGADKVSQLIGISPGHHGSDFNGLVSAVLSVPILRQLFIGVSQAIAPAIYQQSAGSPFQQEIYGNGETRPGVLYTTISTVNDEVATPYTNNALVGPNVTNIVLQDRHPGLILGHLNTVTSPHTWAIVLDALAANPAANPLQHQQAVAA